LNGVLFAYEGGKKSKKGRKEWADENERIGERKSK
jgi:hypothetical protein